MLIGMGIGGIGIGAIGQRKIAAAGVTPTVEYLVVAGGGGRRRF